MTFSSGRTLRGQWDMHKGVLNRNIKHESPLLPLVFPPALMSDDLVTNRFILSCLFKECKEDNEVDTLPLTYLLLSIGQK